MPTSRKRHSVTETDEVASALDRIRAADATGQVNLAELVVLGAERKLQDLALRRDDERRRGELRERFLARTASGEGIDWDAMDEVHERGWSHAADA